MFPDSNVITIRKKGPLAGVTNNASTSIISSDRLNAFWDIMTAL